MPTRFRPVAEPVTITFEGEPIEASAGEPLAVSLVAAGHLALARSPKFHRPRGPACLRAACDGCLARVDDVPNIMTCAVPARAGAVVEAQNVLGSKELDLLRMTDWFFPSGMNHHELFAGVPGLQPIMQSFARRVAGLGRLPARALAPRTASRREVDVLVVGAGPAGMGVALGAVDAGRVVEVIDESLTPGGALRALPGAARAPWTELEDRFRAAVAAGRVRLRLRTLVGGLYGDDALVVGDDGAEVLTARALVLAPGAHDGVVPFEGNDLPGVVSARAACLFLTFGVSLGKQVVVVVPPGGGAFASVFMRACKELGAPGSVERIEGTPVRAHGTTRVRRVTVATAQGEVERDADALVVDAPAAPAYELAVQAGARVRPEARGFVVDAPDGCVRPGVYAVGEVCGVPLDAAVMAAHVASVVASLASRAAR